MLPLQKQAIALKAKLYRGFADPSRLSILEALRGGPLTVTAIVEQTGLSRTNVSNHLRCLSDCDLLTSETRGRYTWYQLSHPKLNDLLTLTEEILRDIAQDISACANYTEEQTLFIEEGTDGESCNP